MIRPGTGVRVRFPPGLPLTACLGRFPGTDGQMSEWFKEPVLKTGDAETHRGSESHSARQPERAKYLLRQTSGTPERRGYSRREGSRPTPKAEQCSNAGRGAADVNAWMGLSFSNVRGKT